VIRSRGRDRQTGEAPTWPSGREEAHSRVLVEHPDPAAQHAVAVGLRRRGYEVVTCGGPLASGMTETACPLLRDERCPAVDGADVVVSGLSLAIDAERAIIRRIAADPCAGRLLVDTTPDKVADHLGAVGVDGYVAPLTVDRILEALVG
jgi:hypothetical protein